MAIKGGLAFEICRGLLLGSVLLLLGGGAVLAGERLGTGAGLAAVGGAVLALLLGGAAVGIYKLKKGLSQD